MWFLFAVLFRSSQRRVYLLSIVLSIMFLRLPSAFIFWTSFEGCKENFFNIACDSRKSNNNVFYQGIQMKWPASFIVSCWLVGYHCFSLQHLLSGSCGKLDCFNLMHRFLTLEHFCVSCIVSRSNMRFFSMVNHAKSRRLKQVRNPLLTSVSK